MPVASYEIDLTIDATFRVMQGVTRISLKRTSAPSDELALLLNSRCEVLRILQDGNPLPFTRKGNHLTILLLPDGRRRHHRIIEVQYEFCHSTCDTDRLPEENDYLTMIALDRHFSRLLAASAWYPQANAAPCHARICIPVGYSLVSSHCIPRAYGGTASVKRYTVQIFYPSHLDLFIGHYQRCTAHFPGLCINFHFLRHRAANRKQEVLAWTRTAHEVLEFYRARIGNCYPWEKLDLVQTVDGHGKKTGLALPALIAVGGKYIFRGCPTALLAHEIAHFYRFRRDREAGLWLSESLSSYLALCYIEQKHGDVTLRNALLAMAKALTQPNAGARHCDALATVSENTDESYDTIHKRGCFVFHMLRVIMGEKGFWQLLRTFFEMHLESGGRSGYREFVETAQVIYGRNLAWFFSPWIFGTEVPKMGVGVERTHDSQGSSVLCFRFHQESDFQELPLPVEVITTAGRTQHLLWISGRECLCRLTTSSRPKTVIFNPNLSILVSLRHEHAEHSAPRLRTSIR